jgi:hypothetical protein
MNKRRLLAYTLSAMGLILALLMLGQQGAAAKQGTKQGQAKSPETTVTSSGKVAQITVSGEARYVLQDGAGKTLYYLEVGPPWYYKSVSKPYPLDKYANQPATVTGVVEQARVKGPKPGKGNARQKPTAPTDAPVMSVHTINGEKVRDAGRPPWAGGPKSVPGHPGSKGKGHKP